MRVEEKRGTPSGRMGALGLGILSGIAERGTASLQTILGESHGSPKRVKRESARTTLWRLEKRGFIERSENGEFRLSEEGSRFLKQKERLPEEPWDGKWRLVTFDIPEKRRRERDWLRSALINAGYSLIQRSVFLGKRPIPHSISETIEERSLSGFVRLIVIGEIDDETFLRHTTS